MTIDKIHNILLALEKEEYFIEDVLELSYYDAVTPKELNDYKEGHYRIHPFWFEVKFELYQILEDIPDDNYLIELTLFMQLILEMRIEKLTFIQMKNKRGIHWKNRKVPKEKINRRIHKNLDGMKGIEEPDEITDTSDYIRAYEYNGTLPLGYETIWYGEIKKELIYYIDDLRNSYNLPKKEKIILDSISEIYSKL
ncbi:hypothetical protein [Sulfurimonas sp.]|jgi:hypothetical protein|uniref:hypothetical protein n=1 Tax=Sulfurimonas sp. TaxID=2022749 RepID=UPI0025DB06AB|nr:hypothetical protein [Sulfurimonas sp.]MBT5934975.1 hypothetical protein [Sulfurimonas sp.]